MKKFRPLMLLSLDGWGVAPPSKGNCITEAKIPTFEKIITQYPVMTLQASGEAVGLMWGEMGNSEVGHLSMGSGRIIYQTLPRINKHISDGSFFKDIEAFHKAKAHVKKNNSHLHLAGLLSNGGVHSHINHLFALLDFCQQESIKDVYIHIFLDGRDTAKDDGIQFVRKLLSKIKEINIGKIATISGRYYAMDRDGRWDRIKQAYLAMAEGISQEKISDPIAAIEKSYSAQIYDEEFVPLVITDRGDPVSTIKDNDAVIFYNFRADRARQLTTAFILPGFSKFERPKYTKNLYFVTFTEYDKDLPLIPAFPPEIIKKPLARVLEENSLKQLHIAETEKYAHVTYFFNGGREEAYRGEDRILVPSAQVTNYDMKPEMSAYEITQRVLKELSRDYYHFLIINFANPDMVGHTGNRVATVKAVEVTDECMGKIIPAVLQKNGVVMVSADHGNAEELINLQTGDIDKEHSTNPVPCIIVGEEWFGKASEFGAELVGNDLSILSSSGMLADVSPTILKIMKLPIPREMTGRPLI